ncbi:MAG: flippase [Thermodesulfobacteriota bacterium]
MNETAGNGISPKRFVRNSLLLITIEIVAKGLGIVFFAMVARFLGAKDLGLYAFSLAVATLVALPTKFGFETVIQREVGRDPSNTYPYFWGIILVKTLIAVTSWGFFLLILMVFPRGAFAVMAVAAGFALVYSFMEFTNAFFRANHRPEIEMVVRLVFSLGNLALGALVLYSGWGLTGVISAQLVSTAVAVSAGALILMQISTKVRFSWNWQVLRGYVLRGAPFAGILLALFLSNQIGVIILTPFAGKEDVGYFAAALRLFDPVTLIPAAIMGAFLPMMSGLYIRSLGQFVRTLRFTMKYMFILALPLVIITGILAQQIVVFLYRESFAPSAQALQILSAVIFFSFWNYTSESVLVARNHERLVLKMTWITAAINVAANLILIYKFSYLGACWAILTTQSIYSVMLFILQLRRYLSLVKLIQIIARPAFCAAIAALVVFLMRHQYLFLSMAAGLTVYVGALLASGAVKRSELNFIHGNIKN